MPSITSFPPFLGTTNAIIANGQTTSGAVDLAGTSLVGIQMPATFSGATITFQVATSLGGTYQTMIDGSGTTVTRTVSQGKYVMLSPADFAGIQFLKIVSSASEGAQRTLELVCRPI